MKKSLPKYFILLTNQSVVINDEWGGLALARKMFPGKKIEEIYLLPYPHNRKSEVTTLTHILEQNDNKEKSN